MVLIVEALKVPELREELKKRGLSTMGARPFLKERLQKAIDAENPGEEGSKKRKAEDEGVRRSTRAKKAVVDAPSKKVAAKPKKATKKAKEVEESEEEESEEEKVEKEEKKEPAKKKAKKETKKTKAKAEKDEEEKVEKDGEKKEKKKEEEEKKEEKEDVVDEAEEKKEEKKEEKEEKKEEKGKAKADAAPTTTTTTTSTSSDDDGWKWKGTLLYWETPDVKHSAKLACFDYDGCLAATSLMKKGPDAWRILYPEVVTKLQELHADGYKLVIMTNQADIGKAAKPETRAKAIAEKKGRLSGFVAKVGLPFQVLVASGKNNVGDPYRKPATGLWTHLIEDGNGGIKPDMDKCFFVGDAAGRKKDHGDTDLKFAQAVGLKFHTETQYFLGKAV